VCTYSTELVEVRASAKGAAGWFPATSASVYVDHPVDFPAGHAVMIDVLNVARGAHDRVGLEMDARSARLLAEAILRTLDSVPVGLLEE